MLPTEEATPDEEAATPDKPSVRKSTTNTEDQTVTTMPSNTGNVVSPHISNIPQSLTKKVKHSSLESYTMW